MPSSIKTKDETEVIIQVSCPESELRPVVKQVFEKLRPKVKAAGFRPGKAPDSIVERELGNNYVQQEVIEAATVASYSKAIQDLGLQVVAHPEVTLQKFVPYSELEYTAKVEVLPEVKLPNYKKINLKRPQVSVDNKEVDQVIEDLRYRQASRMVKKGGAEQGDEVTMDFKGSQNGQELTQASAQNFSARLGAGRLVPGFEEHLLGKTADSETEFDIKMPENYHDQQVAGKTLHFAVKVNAVWQINLPEVDAEFIAAISPFKDEKELRADVHSKLKAQKDDEAGYQYEREVLDELLKQSNFKVPPGLTHQQQHKLLDEFRQQIEGRGLGWEEYLKLSSKSEEVIEQELRPEAERRVRLAILLSEIARSEGLTLSAKDLDAEIAKLKAQYTDIKIQQELDTPDGRESVYNHLMSQKVINRIIEYVEGKK